MIRCGNISSRWIISRSKQHQIGLPWSKLNRHGHGGPHRQIKRSFADRKTENSRLPWRFFTWYSNRLDTHPISTKCISAGLISSFGNSMAQVITFYQEKIDDDNSSNNNNINPNGGDWWKEFSLDPAQVGRFAFLNVIFVAPVLHHWYNFINRVLPGTSIRMVLQRTFWDEFVFSPIYVPVFLTMLWKLEGTPWPKVKSMVVNEVPGIIVAEWALWVPTMLVTFRYAPVKFQVLVINVVNVVWQTFLSFMAAKAHSNADKNAERTNLYLESVVGHETLERRRTTKRSWASHHPNGGAQGSKQEDDHKSGG